MHEDVAVEFARWLTPALSIWINDRIKQVLNKKPEPVEMSSLPGIPKIVFDSVKPIPVLKVQIEEFEKPIQKEIRSDLDLFNFGSKQLRVIQKNGESWFVAKDVCDILEISNVSDTLEKVLDDDEKGIDTIYTPGGKQDVRVVNEPGLYSLVIRSRKPEAKKFKRWITHEVLPAIRKTGSYSIQPTKQLPTNYIDSLKALVASEEEKEKMVKEMIVLEEKIVEDAPPVKLHGKFLKAITILRIFFKPVEISVFFI